jgi:hypothetical protein
MVAKYFILAAILVCILTPVCDNPALADDDFAFNLYAGWMTDGDFGEALSGSAEFVDAYLVLGALAWTFARYFDDALSFELEGQVGKWFGNQKNMEFNLPAVIRWSKFPWDDYVDTSFAYGVGPSYATLEPAQEIENEDDTKKFLVYWFAEFAFGPPESAWAGILRLHHRSGAFGLVADKGHGGSNTLAAGIKYRF